MVHCVPHLCILFLIYWQDFVLLLQVASFLWQIPMVTVYCHHGRSLFWTRWQKVCKKNIRHSGYWTSLIVLDFWRTTASSTFEERQHPWSTDIKRTFFWKAKAFFPPIFMKGPFFSVFSWGLYICPEMPFSELKFAKQFPGKCLW